MTFICIHKACIYGDTPVWQHYITDIRSIAVTIAIQSLKLRESYISIYLCEQKQPNTMS